jgi:hypothetical protein
LRKSERDGSLPGVAAFCLNQDFQDSRINRIGERRFTTRINRLAGRRGVIVDAVSPLDIPVPHLAAGAHRVAGLIEELDVVDVLPHPGTGIPLALEFDRPDMGFRDSRSWIPGLGIGRLHSRTEDHERGQSRSNPKIQRSLHRYPHSRPAI